MRTVPLSLTLCCLWYLVCTDQLNSDSEYNSEENVQIDRSSEENLDSGFPTEVLCNVVDAEQTCVEGRNAITDAWRIFYYYFDYFEGEESWKIIRDAIESARQIVPCISFVEAANLYDFESYNDQKVFFNNGIDQGCNSPVGWNKYSFGFLRINLGNGCLYKNTVIHEIFHALGLHHEHNRPDRDTYITVLWHNVIPKWRFAYNNSKGIKLDVFGVKYNLNSIMHYNSNVKPLNKAIWYPTFVVKNFDGLASTDKFIDEVEVTDLIKLRKIYGCTIPFLVEAFRFFISFETLLVIPFIAEIKPVT